jgi:thiamine biosynthesis lipoprotein
VLSFAISPLASRMADAAPAKLTYTGKAMGTYVTVWFWTDQEATAAKAAESVFAEMKRLDAMMTTWTETSEVSRVNQAAGKKPVAVSAETFAVVERAVDISKKSGGIFDVSVGAFKGLWKFDEDMDNSLPSDEDVNARLSLIGYKDIILNKAKRTVFLKRAGMLINLGGIAKGYAVDRCAAILKKAGFTDFMVQAGGDMYVAGKKGVDPWVVGIRDPRGQRDEMFALMPIENHSFSTSGDYERGFVKDCYPLSVLGVPPAWYKSAAYRARAVREPRGVLAEFGLRLPESIAIRIWDSTSEQRYFVVPERPAGTEGWSEERLARLVTRNAMVGTARALSPAELETA